MKNISNTTLISNTTSQEAFLLGVSKECLAHPFCCCQFPWVTLWTVWQNFPIIQTALSSHRHSSDRAWFLVEM